MEMVQILEWIFVDIIVMLYLEFLKEKNGEFYNIGSNKNNSNLEITKNLSIASDYVEIGNNVKIKYIKDRPGHDIRYALIATKYIKIYSGNHLQILMKD